MTAPPADAARTPDAARPPDAARRGPRAGARLAVGLDARPALFGRAGIARVARQTLAALRRRDDLQVAAFAVAWRARRPGHGVDEPVGPRLPARLLALGAPFGLAVETFTGPLDLFHHTDLSFAPVARAAEVLTIHDLCFLHDASWHGPGFARRVEPRLRRRAAAAAQVVVPSGRVADDVVARGFAPRERVAVVPHGLDHVDPRPREDDRGVVARLLQAAGAGLAEGDLLVLLPGTREPRKNQLALVEAFAALQRCDARLLLVGPAGWGADDLERRLADPSLRGRVAVAGEVDEDVLAACVRAADVVAYPSLDEGFGLPAAEAMACGRAVLTSVATPMADLGGDAVAAVDPRDPRALRAALAELLADGAARAERGAAAAAAVAGLTWDAAATRLAALYHARIGER